MTETELPISIQVLLITLQLAALGFFIYLIWPHLKKEHWKAKFIENPTARSILIVFILILIFVIGLNRFFDAFFPLETLY